MKTTTKLAFAAAIASAPLLLAACSQDALDYRNATVEGGKIFSGEENRAFSGRLTSVPEIELFTAQAGVAQFLRPIARSNKNLNHYGDRAGVTALLAMSKGACTVEVVGGVLDGSASCSSGPSAAAGSTMTFKNGVITGRFAYYNSVSGGRLVSEGTFADGVPEGKQEIYGFDSGNLLMTVVWRGGGLNGPVEKFDEQTGNRVYAGTYVDGVLDGELKEFAPDGHRVTHVATYKEGKLQGVEERYDPSTGAHLAHLTWVDGYLHGRVQKWDASGRSVVDTEYRYGHPASWDRPAPGADPSPSVDSDQPPRASAPPECVDQWVAAYRASAGPDAPASADQLQEWQQHCAEGKLPNADAEK